MYFASGLLGLRCMRLAVALDGFFFAMHLDKHMTAIDPGLGVTRVDRDNPIVVRHRGVRTAHLAD